MGNENFQIILLDESRFIVCLIKWQILKYCTKTTSSQMWFNNDGVLCTSIGWNTPKLKRGEMYLRRKRYMDQQYQGQFWIFLSKIFIWTTFKWSVCSNLKSSFTYSTQSLNNFSTCKSFKTYDTSWDSILLFFIVLKVSSITCPVVSSRKLKTFFI